MGRVSVLSPKYSTSVRFVSIPGRKGGESVVERIQRHRLLRLQATYQVILVGLWLEVLLCSLNENNDVGEGANRVLQRDGEDMRERGLTILHSVSTVT